MALVADPHFGSVPIIEPAAEIWCRNRGSKGGGDAGARPPNARAGTAVAAVRPETTSGGTIARRSLFRSPPEMDGRPEPRTRSRQTKLRRGPGSPFCLVEQGYGVCGARDERAHAGQQQQLVDQLGHDVLPRSGSGKTTTWEQELWFRDDMRTDQRLFRRDR